MVKLFNRILRPRIEREAAQFKRSGNERRRAPRLRTYNLIRYFCERHKELTNLRDISANGLSFRTAVPLRRGEPIEATFNLREIDEQISTLGAISWSSSERSNDHLYYHVGVSFENISEEKRNIIKRYVDEQTVVGDRRLT